MTPGELFLAGMIAAITIGLCEAVQRVRDHQDRKEGQS